MNTKETFMNKPGSGRIFCCLYFLLSVCAAASGNDAPFIVRVDTRDAAGDALQRAGVCVLQRLRSCVLVRVETQPAFDFLRGQKNGRLLAAPEEGEKYYLVRCPTSTDCSELRALGKTILLEPETALFVTSGSEAREILPARFAVKRLALERTATADRSEAVRFIPGAALDPVVAAIRSHVDAGNLTGEITALQNVATREATTAGCENAGNYIAEFFRNAGLTVEEDIFSFAGHSAKNIIGTLPGTSPDSKTVIVCAHYDSTSNDPHNLAPGADDNASGCAAVMEAARIFPAFDFKSTIKFICFSAEEWGLYGSRHYAEAAQDRGETIAGVINLDMIAFTDQVPEDLDLIVDPESEWLADLFAAVSSQYESLPLRTIVNASFTWSDHSPFWDCGYPALCGIEDYDVPNPYYHTTRDTIDKLNLDFALSATRAALVTAAVLARSADATLVITADTGGTTSPAPGTYSCTVNSTKTITAISGTGHVFSHWSGDASGARNPVTLTIDADKTLAAHFRQILPPVQAEGRKVLNRSLSQAQYISILTWQDNPANRDLDVTAYRVYGINGATRTFLADVPSGQHEYWHRQAYGGGGGASTYEITALLGGGNEGFPARVTVTTE
jgi:Zn-dependent M28 family amino/carboxypeptidase